MLRNADGVGGVNFSGEKRYECVRCKQRYSVTRGVGGGPISRNKALRRLAVYIRIFMFSFMIIFKYGGVSVTY